jgi:hypothetical protein
MVLLILGLLIRAISTAVSFKQRSSSCCCLRDWKEVVRRNADPLIYKKIAFSSVHHHLESREPVFTDTPHLETTVVRVRRKDNVANANRRAAECRSPQAILVKALPDRLSRSHGHYGLRLLMIAAPVVFVVNDPGIADVNVAFVAVEV